MKFARRITNTPRVQRAIGIAAAEYLRLVWKTSRFTMEPPDPFGIYEKYEPVIIAMWHGQHFLLPFFRRHYRIKVLVSRHADGEINAVAAERLGVGTIRGSGDHARRFQIKGGVGAFRSMLELLAEGCNMALTADVPKVSRVAGLGIIKLAAEFGPADFSRRPDHKPADRAQQLGSLRNQSAVELRCRGNRGTGTGAGASGRPNARNRARNAGKRP